LGKGQTAAQIAFSYCVIVFVIDFSLKLSQLCTLSKIGKKIAQSPLASFSQLLAAEA
jgi:hypothetical protein